ncbi:hypothetical protein LYSHEL_09750 [Lysobacter helvus]|uniref:Lipoprotein n=3 Tax=Lysobacterales TaxID=135614 RepID=A0ABN6FR98_9GAMM|nr:hypothetical protein LYSCAS_09750 [Lysobacter caseinilyticus]BCT95104.1 hypothetical protein LYSHEL_09750 [Lysobacter helvus]
MNFLAICAFGLLLAACATKPRETAKTEPDTEIVMPPPAVTRGEFLIEADKNDTWNAVGQIAVRTPGVEYAGRSQMMDIYSVRYRGEDFMLQTKAMLLSDTIRKTTTRVTATTQDGKPIDSDAAADLLARIQQALPAEVERVHAQLLADAKAKAAKGKKSKGKAKKKSKKT